MIFDVLLRLEPDPHQRDLARGWAAELGDPVWLLGRQWQMGEHQGEDASSPVTVELAPQATPIGPAAGQDGLDPATLPAQAIIESEPADWWTVGRRVRLGRAVAASAQVHGIGFPASVALAGLPVPYRARRDRPGRAEPVAAARCAGPRRGLVRNARTTARRAGRPLGSRRALLLRRAPGRRRHAHRQPPRRR
jgi:hypothetical protein